MSAIDLADLESHPGMAGPGAADRVDPYWSGTWQSGSTATWVSRTSARRMAEAGLASIPVHLRGDPARALHRVLTGSMRAKRLSILAAVDAWRTCSVDQVAAIVGHPALTASANTLLADAFNADLIEIGQPGSSLTLSAEGRRRGRLLRAAANDVFDRRVAPDLTYAHWVRTTGGRPWRFNTQFDRHDMLTTELCLRVAEFCDVATVLGEKDSPVAGLTAWSRMPHGVEAAGDKMADATIVRNDGARLAVELTASASQQFNDKVRRWAQVLSQAPWDTCGLAVVFVVAPRPDRRHRDVSLVRSVRQAVVTAVKAFPGSVRDRVAQRMAVVEWTDWFPGAHAVTGQFLSLGAARPTGEHGDPWQPCNLLAGDDLPFTPRAEHDATALARNANLLWSTPHWLRRDDATPHLWPLALASSGSMTIPVPARRDGQARPQLGTPSGAVSSTLPPPAVDGR